MLLVIFLIAAMRYIALAGTAYLVCYKLGLQFLKRFKIQKRFPRIKQIKFELLFSLSTLIIFSGTGGIIYFLYLHGFTKIYLDINEYSVAYFLFSIFLMIIIQDMYFYFTHRLLHTRWMLKHVHNIHHRSVNPTPLAAYSFHPLEAFIESVIVIPLVILFPVHYLAFLLFTLLVLMMNVLGHLGFEFIPSRYRGSYLGRLLTSSTHHNLHHQKVNKNFGYYFTWWDRLFKTLDEKCYK